MPCWTSNKNPEFSRGAPLSPIFIPYSFFLHHLTALTHRASLYYCLDPGPTHCSEACSCQSSSIVVSIPAPCSLCPRTLSLNQHLRLVTHWPTPQLHYCLTQIAPKRKWWRQQKFTLVATLLLINSCFGLLAPATDAICKLSTALVKECGWFRDLKGKNDCMGGRNKLLVLLKWSFHADYR